MERYTNIELQHFQRVKFNFYLFEPKFAVYNEPYFDPLGLFLLLPYFCSVELPRYLFAQGK